MRKGYTVVWSGWQHDVPAGGDLLGLQAPVLHGVTGTSREEFIWDNTANPATWTLTYPVADPPDATLTVREREADPRQTPPGLSWRMLDPRRIEVTRPSGFDAGAIYEFIYTARDPVVGGMGFAAVRDLVSFLRHDGGPAGPQRRAGGQPGLRHRHLAERTLPQGHALPGLQRRRGRAAGVRRGHALHQRRPPQLHQRPLVAARTLLPPARGPPVSRRRIPVHLRHHD